LVGRWIGRHIFVPIGLWVVGLIVRRVLLRKALRAERQGRGGEGPGVPLGAAPTESVPSSPAKAAGLPVLVLPAARPEDLDL
jgi:hypothetical protein